MHRPPTLLILAIVAFGVLAALPAQAQAQAQPAPRAEVREVVGSLDYGLHPALMVVAGVVSGVVATSVVGGGLTVATSLIEGMSLVESLEVGTGLSLPAIAASGTLGGLLGFLLSGR